jgi:hypothetical protein
MWYGKGKMMRRDPAGTVSIDVRMSTEAVSRIHCTELRADSTSKSRDTLLSRSFAARLVVSAGCLNRGGGVGWGGQWLLLRLLLWLLLMLTVIVIVIVIIINVYSPLK